MPPNLYKVQFEWGNDSTLNTSNPETTNYPNTLMLYNSSFLELLKDPNSIEERGADIGNCPGNCVIKGAA